jgi:hypothetical protein
VFHETNQSLDLLAEWRWLLGGLPKLLGWSSSGDLFVVDTDGVVSRLDTGSGDLESVAATKDEFYRALQVTTKAEDMLMLSVVREFNQREGPLGPEECLGFTTLPILGGSYTIANRYRLRIAEHAAMTGGVHRQARELSDGTPVRINIVP